MKTLNSIRILLLAAASLLQLGALSFRAPAAAGDVDLSFDPGSGVNGSVSIVAVQPDGKVIVAGDFTTVKGLARTNLARLHADGTGDATFDAGPGVGRLTALTLQPDGKVLVAGLFSNPFCDGCCYPETVVRLNADGSRDNTFTAATVEYSENPREIRCLVPLPGGKILVGGYFYSINGTNRVGIARLQANGTLDTSFNTTPSLNGTVQRVVLQPDGKAVIAGVFTASGPASRSGAARLNTDGSLDPTFDAGISLQEDFDFPPYGPCSEFTEITALALQPDGKLLVGVFKRLYEIEDEGVWNLISDRYFVERRHTNGGNDATFVFTNSAQMALVGGLIVQPDGRVLVQHGFNTSQIARLNGNGSWDDSFQPGPSSGDARAAALQPDGKVLIGGSAVTVGPEHSQPLSRLNADGSHDTTFDSGKGLARAVAQIALQPDGKVLIGGPLVVGDPYFGPLSDVLAFVNGTNCYGRARLNVNGSSDGTFVSSTHFNPHLSALLNPVDCLGDPRFGCLLGALVTAVLVQSDGRVLMSGHIVTTITGDETFVQSYRPFLHRFTVAGAWESDFNLSDTWVSSMAQQPDGKIVIGGSLTLNGTNSTVARLHADGSVDGSFQLGQGPASVSSLVLQTDGKIVVGGATVARLNNNGSRDLGFSSITLSNGEARTLALQPDGKVLMGGSFTSVNGTNRNRIARLYSHGALDTSLDPGAGPDGAVRSIALQPDGNILIAGDFKTVNGTLRQYVARLYGDAGASLPSLSLARSGGALNLTWPMTTLNFQLQESTNLALPNAWSPVAQSRMTNGAQISVTVPTSAGRKFFRLKSP